MKLYIKNGIIKKSEDIVIEKDTEGKPSQTFNPSEDMILSDGWTIYMLPLDIQYKERIVELIRSKYSIDDEFAIHRKRDINDEEFAEYNDYVESCKQIAYKEIYES